MTIPSQPALTGSQIGQKVTVPESPLSGTFRPFIGKRQIQAALDYPPVKSCQESQESVFPGSWLPGNRLIRDQILFVWFGAGSAFLVKS